MSLRDKGRTPAERKLLEKIEDKGEAWIVPSQHRLAGRLNRRGLLLVTQESRYNPLRGSVERRCVPVPENRQWHVTCSPRTRSQH